MAWIRSSLASGGGGGAYDDFFASATLIPNTYIDGGGTEVPYNDWTSTDYIEIPSTADYLYRCGALADCNWNAFYNSSKTFISRFNDSTKQTIPSGAKYVRLSGVTANVTGNLFMKV